MGMSIFSRMPSTAVALVAVSLGVGCGSDAGTAPASKSASKPASNPAAKPVSKPAAGTASASPALVSGSPPASPWTGGAAATKSPAQTRPAGPEPANSNWDWNRLAVIGDVTEQVRPFLRDGKLDFGSASISGGAAIALTRAELQSGKLLLTIQVSQPERVVRFEGLSGTLGNYQPQGLPRRPVTIRGKSHDERFARRGVLQIGIPHPHPERIRQPTIAQSSLADEMRQEAERPKKGRKKEGAGKVARNQSAAPENPAVALNQDGGQKGGQKGGPKSKTKDGTKGGPKGSAPSLIPGPETGYKPRSLEFTKLAVAVSALYRMPGRDTFRPEQRIRVDAARAAVAYPNPKLQAYASKMLDRMQQNQAIDVDAVRAELTEEAERMSRRTLEYGAAKGSYTDSDGRTRTVLADGSEPDLAAREKAGELRALAQGSDEEIRRYIAQKRDQNTIFDLVFGNGISNRLDDLYSNIINDAYVVLAEDAKKAAGPLSPDCLVQIDRPDSSTPVLTNASPRTLTDVVVNLSWGFHRSEKLQTYGHGQFVFIPIWKPKEAVQLQKIQLREPSVMHVKVDVYANESSSEAHVFALPDPSSPPNNQPGTIVVAEHRGFASIGKPRFAGTAWVEVDGKKVEWKAVDNPLEVPVEPGMHKVVVHAREKGRAPRLIKEQQLPVDGGETRALDVSFSD